MENSPEFIVLFGGLVAVGVTLTVVYYFARYYFRTSKKDQEVVSSIPDKTSSDLAEELVDQEKLEATLKEKSELDPEVVSKDSAPTLKEEPSVEVVEKPKPSALVKEEEKVDEIPPQKSIEEALSATKKGFWGRIKQNLSGSIQLGDDEMEELEEVLYTSDLGPMTVQKLLDAVEESLGRSEKKDLSKVQVALKSKMLDIFGSAGERFSLEKWVESLKASSELQTILVVGVNGAGKTTSIGKLAYRLANEGLKVMVAAGDTFRAAAGEQLKVWTERAQVEIFHPEGVKDPGAVAFDACQTAKAKGYDVLLVDTAGRLHNQGHLMEELKKVKRVMKKVDPNAPNQTWIVLDANSGQNALLQAKTFHQDLELTGVILTKLDGSAKGGVAVGIANELRVPICLIGVGEGIMDLRDFKYEEFVDSIL